MVEQDAKKVGLKFKARVQLDLYDDLFSRRLQGENIKINKAMEQSFTLNPTTAKEHAIASKILKWNELQATKAQATLFKQKKRLADAERIIATKPTKKATNDIRVATNRIKKLKNDIPRYSTTEILQESESRIFPRHYMTMLMLDENGEKVVAPVRYLIRPHDKDAKFDLKYKGCYNARLDNLDNVKWWKDCLGQRHGIILVKKFYEHVPTSKFSENNELPPQFIGQKDMVLCFEPNNVEYMFIPTLWDEWKGDGKSSLISAALITDDPAPEIARAGHDRTPIFLKQNVVDSWLNAKGRSVKELKEIFDERERPYYAHRIIGVA